MRAAHWLTLLAFGVAAACGGHTANDTDETTNVAGSTNSKQKDPAPAGKASGQGGSDGSSGGTGSGATSSGGQVDVAGAATLGVENAAGAGGSCHCDPEMQCDPGYVVSEEPGKCCRCVLDCLSVGCVELDCPAGTHEVQESWECCPSCVEDEPLSCEEAKQKYDGKRSELVSQAQSVGCKVDDDCSRFWEQNRCNQTCGAPIPEAAREALEDELDAFAEDNCSNCPEPDPIPCARPLPPTCVDGACQ